MQQVAVTYGSRANLVFEKANVRQIQLTAWAIAERLQDILEANADEKGYPSPVVNDVFVRNGFVVVGIDPKSVQSARVRAHILDSMTLAGYSTDPHIRRAVWGLKRFPLYSSQFVEGIWLVTSWLDPEQQARLAQARVEQVPIIEAKIKPILDDMEFLKHRPEGEYMIGLGALIDDGSYLWRSLLDTEHIIVSGATQTGKSTFARSILYQFANQDLPLELYLFDLLNKTFPWAKKWNITMSYGTTVDDALAITSRLHQEMERRRVKFEALHARNIYPENWREYYEETGERLPLVIAVFEEMTALAEMIGVDHPIMHNFNQLAMKAAGFGIILVLVGQDFPAEYFPTPLTNNFKTRVAHRCQRFEQSKRCLGEGGAEVLTVKGQALVKLEGPASPSQLIQGFNVPKRVVTGDVTPVRDGEPEPLAPEPVQQMFQANRPRPTTPLSIEAENARRIRDLAAQGTSRRRIEKEVFGYMGGAAHDAVERALRATRIETE